MFLLESSLYFSVIALALGYYLGRKRILKDTTNTYPTRRLTRQQERALKNGIQQARVYVKSKSAFQD